MTAVEELHALMARLKNAQEEVLFGIARVQREISALEVTVKWRDPNEDSKNIAREAQRMADELRASVIRLRRYQLRQAIFAEIEAIRAVLPDVAARASIELGAIAREFRDGQS